MRVSTEEKSRSRDRILTSAARRMRSDGLAGAGLSEVMRDAGLTHGGFYRHFASRDAMLAAALDTAFAAFLEPLAKAKDPVAAAQAFRETYLSADHVAHPEQGCPVPAIGSEMSHAADPLRAAFGAGLDRVITLIAAGKSGTPEAQRTHALRDFAMLAGAIMLARAAPPALAAALLTACAEPA